jgi:hypothetical protein
MFEADYYDRWFEDEENSCFFVLDEAKTSRTPSIILSMSFDGEFPNMMEIRLDTDYSHTMPSRVHIEDLPDFPSIFASFDEPYPFVDEIDPYFDFLESQSGKKIPSVFRENAKAYLRHMDQGFQMEIDLGSSKFDEQYMYRVFYFPEYKPGSGDFLSLSNNLTGYKILGSVHGVRSKIIGKIQDEAKSVNDSNTCRQAQEVIERLNSIIPAAVVIEPE